MRRSWAFTDGGGLRFWREDEDGNLIDEVVLNPMSDGCGEIGFTTTDGVSKRGEIEPGGANSRLVGQ